MLCNICIYTTSICYAIQLYFKQVGHVWVSQVQVFQLEHLYIEDVTRQSEAL